MFRTWSGGAGEDLAVVEVAKYDRAAAGEAEVEPHRAFDVEAVAGVLVRRAKLGAVPAGQVAERCGREQLALFEHLARRLSDDEFARRSRPDQAKNSRKHEMPRLKCR